MNDATRMREQNLMSRASSVDLSGSTPPLTPKPSSASLCPVPHTAPSSPPAHALRSSQILDQSSPLSDATPVSELVTRIIDRLALAEDPSPYIAILHQNFIKTFGHLRRLPSVSYLERLKLPLLLETELSLVVQTGLYSSPLASFPDVIGASTASSKSGLASSISSSSLAKGALFGLSDETKAAMKALWASLTQAQGNTSLLPQFASFVPFPSAINAGLTFSLRVANL